MYYRCTWSKVGFRGNCKILDSVKQFLPAPANLKNKAIPLFGLYIVYKLRLVAQLPAGLWNGPDKNYSPAS